jgi:ABC-type amino acid transport substrate-binding protein
MACISTFCLQASSPLIVGTNAEFPPFCSIEKGEIVGFDVDVAKEVARRLEREIQFKDMPFDALIPALCLGQVDFVAAGMSATEERAKRVLFTKPYLAEDPLVSFTMKGKLGLEDLKGKKVVVVEGFTADLFLSSQPGIEIVRLPSQADGFMAVKNGRADAFITAASTVAAFYEKQDASAYQTTPIPGTGETCALVVPKTKPLILEAVQKALDGMEQDGTFANLKAKWKLNHD